MPFQKGHIPWHKGTKGIKKANSGSFKPGDKRLLGNEFSKGQQSWSKGLTKDDHPSLKIVSEKLKDRYKIHVKLGKRCTICNKLLKDRKFCSWSCVKKHRKQKGSWNKGIKGKKSHSYGHKLYVTDKNKRREYALLGRQALDRSKKPTNIERIVYAYLEKRNIVFEKQKLVNKRFLVDVFIPKNNLVIECDGEYWHNLDRVKKKDKAENAYLDKCGFNMLRLKEGEILNNNFERKLKWL